MQDLQDITNKLGNLEDVGLKVQAERIQLAIAERLDGILTEMKAMNKPNRDFMKGLREVVRKDDPIR